MRSLFSHLRFASLDDYAEQPLLSRVSANERETENASKPIHFGEKSGSNIVSQTLHNLVYAKKENAFAALKKTGEFIKENYSTRHPELPFPDAKNAKTLSQCTKLNSKCVQELIRYLEQLYGKIEHTPEADALVKVLAESAASLPGETTLDGYVSFVKCLCHRHFLKNGSHAPWKSVKALFPTDRLKTSSRSYAGMLHEAIAQRSINGVIELLMDPDFKVSSQDARQCLTLRKPVHHPLEYAILDLFNDCGLDKDLDPAYIGKDANQCIPLSGQSLKKCLNTLFEMYAGLPHYEEAKIYHQIANTVNTLQSELGLDLPGLETENDHDLRKLTISRISLRDLHTALSRAYSEMESHQVGFFLSSLKTLASKLPCGGKYDAFLSNIALFHYEHFAATGEMRPLQMMKIQFPFPANSDRNARMLRVAANAGSLNYIAEVLADPDFFMTYAHAENQLTRAGMLQEPFRAPILELLLAKGMDPTTCYKNDRTEIRFTADERASVRNKLESEVNAWTATTQEPAISLLHSA